MSITTTTCTITIGTTHGTTVKRTGAPGIVFPENTIQGNTETEIGTETGRMSCPYPEAGISFYSAINRRGREFFSPSLFPLSGEVLKQHLLNYEFWTLAFFVIFCALFGLLKKHGLVGIIYWKTKCTCLFINCSIHNSEGIISNLAAVAVIFRYRGNWCDTKKGP